MTPQERIREEPYRFSAHVTPQDEAWIAAHMARSVMSERKASPYTSLFGQNHAAHTERRLSAHVERANERYAELIKLMGKEKITSTAFAAMAGCSNKSAHNILRSMRQKGMVEIVGKAGHCVLWKVVK